MKVIKVYCDTDTLLNNIGRHHNAKAQQELEALERLLAYLKAGKITMFRSRVNLRETEGTKDPQQRQKLRGDYERLTAIPNDVKYLGSYSLPDGSGGVMASDVQDEAMCDELLQMGLTRRDAEHLTQAICNHCDIFLTRDEKTIIKYRTKIEARFSIKVKTPSQLAGEI